MNLLTTAKGFQITFDNGYTISIQHGSGNYCENYCNETWDSSSYSSNDAEIAIWDYNDKWYNFDSNRMEDGTNVQGHIPIDEVVDWISSVKHWI